MTSKTSVLALVLASTSCGGGGGPHTQSPAPAPVSTPVLFEIEPNDHAAHPDFIGSVHPGRDFWIQGFITQLDVALEGYAGSSGPDPFDGFAFYAEAPVEVEVYLTAYDPSADLDFCVFDPLANDFVFCFENPGDVEWGAFVVSDPGTEFHIVVTSYRGDTDYDLEVYAYPLALATTDGGAAPVTEPARIRASERTAPLRARVLALSAEGKEAQQRAGYLFDQPEGEDDTLVLVPRGRLLVLDADRILSAPLFSADRTIVPGELRPLEQR